MLYSMFETASEPPGIDDAIPFAPAGPQDQAPATASDDHPRTHVAVLAESGTVILVGMADEECVDVPAALGVTAQPLTQQPRQVAVARWEERDLRAHRVLPPSLRMIVILAIVVHMITRGEDAVKGGHA